MRRAVAHLRRADPVLAGVIRDVGPCRFAPRGGDSHFAALAKAILYQQLSGKAAATIHARFRALYGGRSPTPRELLATPAPELRSAGVSTQKVSYLADLAARVVSRDLPIDQLDRLGDEAVIDALIRVKGVGRWTAQMFLMFRLGRPDVLPDGDLGIRKAVQRTYRMRRLPEPEKLQRIGAPWRPFRTIACWYLWRSLDGLPPVDRADAL